jgi:hypothetical protein
MSGSITPETPANVNADIEHQEQEEQDEEEEQEEPEEQDPAMLEMEKALQEIERIVLENKRLSLQRRKAVFASCQIILGGNIADFQQGVRTSDSAMKTPPSLVGPNGEVDKYYAMSLSIMSRSDRFESIFDAVKGVTRTKTPLTRLCDEYKLSNGCSSSSSSLSNSQSLDSLRGRKTVDNSAIRPSMSTPKRNASWGQSPNYWKDAANEMDTSNHNKNKNNQTAVEPRLVPQRNVPTAKTA